MPRAAALRVEASARWGDRRAKGLTTTQLLDNAHLNSTFFKLEKNHTSDILKYVYIELPRLNERRVLDRQSYTSKNFGMELIAFEPSFEKSFIKVITTIY